MCWKSRLMDGADVSQVVKEFVIAPEQSRFP